MPTFKQPPASIRYLKARLHILKRPQVWATASGLALSVFLVGVYLVNSQQYTSSNDLDAATDSFNPSGNLPSQNLSASNSELFETLPDLSTVPTQTSLDSQSLKSDNSRSPLFQEFLLDQPSIAAQNNKPGRSQSSSFSTSSSFEAQRDRPSASRIPSFSSPESPSSGFPGSTFSSPANHSATSSLNGSPTVNPLQSALDRYSPNSRQSQFSPASLSQPSVDNSSRGSGLSPTEDSVRQDTGGQQSSPQGFSSPQFAPQLSPFPGTTGYTLPPTLRTSTPSTSPSFNSNLQPIPGQITPQTAPTAPGQSYDYGQPSYPSASQTTAYPNAQPSLAPYSQPMPSPFSVPRAVPGRSIGGGQINTFSNP